MICMNQISERVRRTSAAQRRRSTVCVDTSGNHPGFIYLAMSRTVVRFPGKGHGVSLEARQRNKTLVNIKARWIQACAAISDLYKAPNPSLTPPLSLKITRSISAVALT